MTRFVLFLAFALAAGPSLAEDSLYKAFGEKAGLTALMDDFVDRLARDARTERFFKNANHPRLKAQLTEQLCMLAGGPCQYAGRDMKSAHTGMGVDKAHFNGLVEVLQESMDAKRIPFTEQNRMLALLAPMHRDIIAK
jgi:hemoglobin